MARHSPANVHFQLCSGRWHKRPIDLAKSSGYLIHSMVDVFGWRLSHFYNPLNNHCYLWYFHSIWLLCESLHELDWIQWEWNQGNGNLTRANYMFCHVFWWMEQRHDEMIQLILSTKTKLYCAWLDASRSVQTRQSPVYCQFRWRVQNMESWPERARMRVRVRERKECEEEWTIFERIFLLRVFCSFHHFTQDAMCFERHQYTMMINQLDVPEKEQQKPRRQQQQQQ